MSVEIDLAGSKSFTNRALILAAQAKGETILENASNSDDTKVLIDGLSKFGIEIKRSDSNLIINRPEELIAYKGVIDVGPAGTSMRFLTTFAASVPGAEVELRGSERMHQRPIADLVEALKSQGVKIDYLEQEGNPPLKVYGNLKQTSFSIELNSNISSQFLTSILLSAPSLASYLEVFVSGEMVSSSYVNMTLEMMKQFDLNVINEEFNYFLVAQTEPQPGKYRMEGDGTGAAYFWALAAATNTTIRVNNILINSTQGDLKFLDVLKSMDCQVEASSESEKAWVEVRGIDNLKAVEADFDLMPDSGQTIIALAALVEGKSTISGLSTLKHKETDRLQAMATELKKINIKTEINDDSIVVHGGTIQIPDDGVEIDTYDDHRMAMSFAIIAAKYPNIKIKNPEVVSKSFPDFWDRISDCGIELQ